MSTVLVQLKRRPFGKTMRKGAWWLPSLLTFIGLGAFVVYSTWAAFQGNNYRFDHYLSPMYSPELFGSARALFGPIPSWIPSWLPFSPALLILWAPGGFRFTCYYYRGAYYKAMWADPISCAVGEPRTGYRGEKKFPLILQNIHRYFLYLALMFLIVLAYDAYEAMWLTDAAGKVHFGIGVGTVILTANVICLSLYTFSCHSLRHLIGGRKKELSKNKMQKACYDCVSGLNTRHMLYAWISLFVVGFSDIYVRLCALGVWHDFRIYLM